MADSEMVYFFFFFRMFGLLLAVSYSTACLSRLEKQPPLSFLSLNVSEGPIHAYSFFFLYGISFAAKYFCQDGNGGLRSYFLRLCRFVWCNDMHMLEEGSITKFKFTVNVQL